MALLLTTYWWERCTWAAFILWSPFNPAYSGFLPHFSTGPRFLYVVRGSANSNGDLQITSRDHLVICNVRDPGSFYSSFHPCPYDLNGSSSCPRPAAWGKGKRSASYPYNTAVIHLSISCSNQIYCFVVILNNVLYPLIWKIKYFMLLTLPSWCSLLLM